MGATTEENISSTEELINKMNEATQEVKQDAKIFNPLDKPEQKPTGEDFSENAHLEEIATILESDEEPKSKSAAGSGTAVNPYLYSATKYIKVFNVVTKWVLKPMYRNRIMKPGDSEKVDELIAENPNFSVKEAIKKDPELLPLLKRYQRLENSIKELPFTDEEIKDIAEPLSEVLAKNPTWKISPETSLVMSVAMVMLPRLEPLFPNIGSFFERITGSKNEGK